MSPASPALSNPNFTAGPSPVNLVAVMNAIVAGVPLRQILETLVLEIERVSSAGLIGSILLLDADGKHLHRGAAPSLPADYNDAIDGIAIGPAAGSCGTAAYSRQPVHVSDISRDPLWKDFRDLAGKHGLRACWSSPIIGGDGKVLGTFAMYYRVACAAPESDQKLVEIATHSAALIVERDRTEQRLRASEAKFATAFGQSPLGLTITALDTGRLIDVNQHLLNVSGYTRDDLVGQRPDELGLWSKDQLRRQRFDLLREGQRPLDIEARFRVKSGAEMDCLVASNVVVIGGQSCVLTSIVDITERKRNEHELRLLQDLSSELIHNGGAETLYEKIISSARTLMRADFASMQLLHPHRGDGGELELVASYGFTPEARNFWTWVNADGDSTCGAGLASGKRAIVPDIELSKEMAGTADLATYRQTGIRAVQSTPLLARNGQLVGMLSTHWRQPHSPTEHELGLLDILARQAADLMERKIADAALHESEQELNDFFENAPVGVHWMDADGMVLRVNRAELALLGYAADEYVGHQIAQFHADQAVIEDIRRRLLAREEVHEREATLRCKDGSLRQVLITCNGLWRGGKFIHSRCFTRDISERKRAEDDLKEAGRRKDEFLAMLAHELRNPLAPISNSLSLLRLSGVNPPIQEMMERQVKHMVHLVDDLLEVSRISRGKIELRRERMDLRSAITSAVEASSPLINAGGHQLRVSLPDAPLWLDADGVRLAQVFINLLNNAAKYTPQGGKIELTAQAAAGQASVNVRDNGSGIPPDMLARIFEMFTQVDRTLERAQGGLGIGLSLARTLVEMHGGRLQAHSEGLNQGSEFSVRLPLATSAAAAAPAPPAIKQGRAPLQLPRVLVVDDNRDAADSLVLLLKFLGAEVQVAYTGATALELIASHRPQAVFLDLGMPDMNGFETARRIRERHRDSISLIALTGWGQQEDRQRTQAGGFNHHLVKPPDATTLQVLLGSLKRPAN